MIKTVFLVFSIINSIVEGALMILNLRHSQKYLKADNVPKTLDFLDKATFQKSLHYTIEKSYFGLVHHIFDEALSFIFIQSELFPRLFNFFHIFFQESVFPSNSSYLSYFHCSLLTESLALWTMNTLLSVTDIPFSLYSIFVLEEKFGFNKQTLRLFFTDLVKETFISVLLEVPLLAGLFKIFHLIPDTWWIWSFFLIFGFQVLMIIVYPKFILPLFNTLIPLEDWEKQEREKKEKELKEKEEEKAKIEEGSDKLIEKNENIESPTPLKDGIVGLLQKCGFFSFKIEVMDGSTRSAHSNALFTGFGSKFKRIILYDTLIHQLEPKEINAVLGHEIGHYQKNHIYKSLALMCVMMLAFLFGIHKSLNYPKLVQSFGYSTEDLSKQCPNIHSTLIPTILVFSMVTGTILNLIATPLMNMFSRKHEYEADNYSRDVAMSGSELELISALRKIQEKNLSNFVPHPLYSFWNYSHPTMIEREENLRNKKKQ